jgi:hypothetical protein
MSNSIEVDAYEDYGESYKPHKVRHKTPIKYSEENRPINKDISKRNSLVSLISNQLQAFPFHTVSDEENDAISQPLQQYVTWITESLIHQQPLIDPDRDFKGEYAPNKSNQNYRLIHRLSGIRVRYDTPEDNATLLDARVRLYTQIEKHFQYWQQLKKIDGMAFDPTSIVNTILHSPKPPSIQTP